MTEGALALPQDYADLLRALVEADAEFVLVGGWAVAVHGHGRATDDLDVLVRPTPENAVRVYRGLDAFGAPLAFHGVTEDLFAKPGYGYRVGRKPLLIEVLTRISGVSFDDAVTNAVIVHVAGVRVPVLRFVSNGRVLQVVALDAQREPVLVRGDPADA